MALPLAPSLPETPGMRLSDVPPGRQVLILSVDAASTAGRRLLDLGFVPDTRVRVVRRAPLGDPIAFSLRGTQLCLRRVEAALIRVQAADPDRTP